MTKSDLPSLQVQRTARLRAKPSLHWKYLFHLIRSSRYVTYLLDGQTGLGVPHISGKQILSFELSLPPVSEQQKIAAQVKLADGKERTIQHMTMTSFWHPDGTPMSAQQFMEMLFGKLPDFFKDEHELRTLCHRRPRRSRGDQRSLRRLPEISLRREGGVDSERITWKSRAEA